MNLTLDTTRRELGDANRAVEITANASSKRLNIKGF